MLLKLPSPKSFNTTPNTTHILKEFATPSPLSAPDTYTRLSKTSLIFTLDARPPRSRSLKLPFKFASLSRLRSLSLLPLFCALRASVYCHPPFSHSSPLNPSLSPRAGLLLCHPLLPFPCPIPCQHYATTTSQPESQPQTRLRVLWHAATCPR